MMQLLICRNKKRQNFTKNLSKHYRIMKAQNYGVYYKRNKQHIKTTKWNDEPSDFWLNTYLKSTFL